MSDCTESKLWILAGQIIGGVIVLVFFHFYDRYKRNKFKF